jgi:hypothetical protein
MRRLVTAVSIATHKSSYISHYVIYYGRESPLNLYASWIESHFFVSLLRFNMFDLSQGGTPLLALILARWVSVPIRPVFEISTVTQLVKKFPASRKPHSRTLYWDDWIESTPINSHRHHHHHHHHHTVRSGIAAILCTPIWEAFGSNLGRHAGYPDWGVSWCSQSLQTNSTIASSQILSSSSIDVPFHAINNSVE